LTSSLSEIRASHWRITALRSVPYQICRRVLDSVIQRYYTWEVASEAEPMYRGVPLSRLRIDWIVWTPTRAAHIRNRIERKNDPREINLEPEWATEAVMDSDALVGLSKTSEAIHIIGKSRSADMVLKVWLLPIDMADGVWAGVSACEANSGEKYRYERGWWR
jgi:hypothetical protein